MKLPPGMKETDRIYSDQGVKCAVVEMTLANVSDDMMDIFFGSHWRTLMSQPQIESWENEGGFISGLR